MGVFLQQRLGGCNGLHKFTPIEQSPHVTSCRLVLVWRGTTTGGNTEQRRHPGHSNSMYASFVSKCGIIGYCVPSISHMTLGNLAVENESTLILSAARRGEPMCCSCRLAVALSTPDSTRVRLTSLLYVPPSAGETPRPRDEESAEAWPTRGCHDSSWSLILNQTRPSRTWQHALTFHLIISLMQGEWML